jgi:hypothetical protein
VFILAVFVGWQLISNVSHSLHTPLMAVTNAISGIIVIGGLLQTTDDMSKHNDHTCFHCNFGCEYKYCWWICGYTSYVENV